MKNIFNEHPNAVGETLFSTFFKIFCSCIKLTFIALRSFIHAVFPWWFQLLSKSLEVFLLCRILFKFLILSLVLC